MQSRHLSAEEGFGVHCRGGASAGGFSEMNRVISKGRSKLAGKTTDAMMRVALQAPKSQAKFMQLYGEKVQTKFMGLLNRRNVPDAPRRVHVASEQAGSEQAGPSEQPCPSSSSSSSASDDEDEDDENGFMTFSDQEE
jgi:hypothetical protein